MGAVSHCHAYCHPARLHDLMIHGKYGPVIGCKTCTVVQAHSVFPGYRIIPANHSAVSGYGLVPANHSAVFPLLNKSWKFASW